MSLLLAGLAQGIGSGLSAYGKQQADEQELTRKEQQAARSELVKELLQDKRLAAQEALTEKRLASQEKIADQRNEQMLKQMEANIIRSEIAAGATERAAQIRADATIRALMARDKAGSKPSAEDLKFARGIDAIAAKNGIEPEYLQELGRVQQTHQYTPNVAKHGLIAKGLLIQDGNGMYVTGGDGYTQVPVSESDLPYLAGKYSSQHNSLQVQKILEANKQVLDEYNNFRLYGAKEYTHKDGRLSSVDIKRMQDININNLKLLEEERKNIPRDLKPEERAKKIADIDKQMARLRQETIGMKSGGLLYGLNPVQAEFMNSQEINKSD